MALQTVNVCPNSNLRFFGMYIILLVNSKFKISQIRGH